MSENDDAPNDAGYSEREIQEVVTNDRFLAIVDAYSRDCFTIGAATFLIDQESDSQVRQAIARIISPWSYSHLVHEIAKRIRVRTVAVPRDSESRFPELYHPALTRMSRLYETGLGVFKFSAFEAMSRDDNPLTIWRKTCTQTDIEELIKDRRILAHIDAMAKGLVSGGTVRERILGRSPTHGPRDLSITAFTHFIFEVYRRIRSGNIQVPSELATEFPSAYEPEQVDPQ